LIACVQHICAQLLLFVPGACGVGPVLLRVRRGAPHLQSGALDISSKPRDLGPRTLDFLVGASPCSVDLLLRLTAQFLEALAKLANLRLRRALQIVAMLLRSRTNLNELAFRFLANLRCDFVRRCGHRAFLVFRRGAHDLLRKIVQLGFEMLTQFGRRAVERRAKLVVERH